MISITDAVFQTQLFIIFFLVVMFVTTRFRQAFKFDNSLTEELKGFAMLSIVFSHIGYFLVSDHRFLYPLSVAAGVGVNLFLLLSGYGLTISSLKNNLPIKVFYIRRLLKLFIPLWIVLTGFIIVDYFLLHQTYTPKYLIESFLGLYLTSNPFEDINSPLWYFSLILFFYLIFPIIFRPKWPLISGLAILLVTYLALQIPLPTHADNVALYKLHFFAFPLGVIFAAIKDKFKFKLNLWMSLICLVVFSLLFGYFAIHSGVGEDPFKEQLISLISVILILAIGLIKKIRFGLLNLVGKYSYEIYLLHWPILMRYDHFFQNLPASLAVAFYLIEFILLGIILQKVSLKITKQLKIK